MSGDYEAWRARARHPRVRGTSNAAALLAAAATVAGVWSGRWLVVVAVAAVVAVGLRAAALAACCLVLGLAGVRLGQYSWQHAVPRHLGGYEGWAQIVGSPTAAGGATRVTLKVDGERFDTWLYGIRYRQLAQRDGGEVVWVVGTRRPISNGVRRAQERHVVGRFDLRVAGDAAVGAPVQRASLRVRGALRDAAAASMPADDASLFTGLVIGDDSRQPPAMIDAFRAAGLSHLTAVSGQNVAFVLVAASPLLRRLRPLWRWAATLALIGWFMALTQFEPSVLRAGVMAMLSASAFALGRDRSPMRLLCIAVAVLVLVDPMLVWSVGFWLSVGATAGVTVAGPWLRSRLPGPPWLRAQLAVILGAQLGVALPSLLVFGRLPLVSLPANLLAAGPAGFVMLYGIPAGVGCALLPAAGVRVAMWPAMIATHWVAVVAALAARIEPPQPWPWVGWGLVVVAVVCARRAIPPPAADVAV